MKKFTKTNKIVIVTILVLFAAAATIFGVKAYSNYQDKQAINSSLSEISKLDKNFAVEADSAKKLTILKNIENEYSSYKKSQKVFSDVNNKYTDAISKMKKVFTDGYDEVVTKNTLSNIDKITDKNSLNNAKTNLQNELKLITDDKDIVCDAKDLTNYNARIETIIKSYDARIKSIEDEAAKAAAEAKAKQEAQAKVKAEADRKAAAARSEAQQTVASTNGNGSGSYDGGTSTSNNGYSKSSGGSSTNKSTSGKGSTAKRSSGGSTRKVNSWSELANTTSFYGETLILPNGVVIPSGYLYIVPPQGNDPSSAEFWYPGTAAINGVGERYNRGD